MRHILDEFLCALGMAWVAGVFLTESGYRMLMRHPR